MTALAVRGSIPRLVAILLVLVLGACRTGHVIPDASPTPVPAVATLGPRGDFPDGIAVTGPRNAIATVPPLYYWAGLRFPNPDPDAEAGRMRLQPYVHITNNSRSQSAEIHLSGCPISLRMYPEPYRDEPPVWDGARFRERAGGCRQKDFVVAIEPGASYEATDEIDPADLFDDSVPDGQYRFSVVFTHVERPPMQLGVWNAFVTRGPGGLAFTAETRIVDVAPRRLEVIVTLTNVSDKTLRFEHSACAVWLKAHSRSDRAGTPVWDELKRPNPDPNTGVLRVCSDPLFSTELEPGASARPEEFHKVLAEPDVLGDLLPDGPYYFTATVEVNGAKFDIAAGRADLARVQQPLNAAKTATPRPALALDATPTPTPTPRPRLLALLVGVLVDRSGCLSVANEQGADALVWTKREHVVSRDGSTVVVTDTYNGKAVTVTWQLGQEVRLGGGSSGPPDEKQGTFTVGDCAAPYFGVGDPLGDLR